MRRIMLNLLLVVALLLGLVTPVFAQEEPDAPMPSDAPIVPPDAFDQGFKAFIPITANGPDYVEVDAVDGNLADMGGLQVDAGRLAALRLGDGAPLVAGAVPAPGALGGRLNPALQGATGRVQLVISMSKPSSAQQAASADGSAEAQVNAGMEVMAQQEPLVGWILARDPSARVMARLRVAMNAVIVEMNAALLNDVVLQPGVVRVNPVVAYELDLSETVPYIGATAVQNAGFTGSGVVVAVLDSGIDYTHFNLGGAGTLEAYEAAYGTDPSDPRNTTRDGLFPTGKVVDGIDFVGEDWPNTPEATDPDPIDWQGHGTHVADIIAGKSSDGTHKGVAPDASLMAVKVCSAVATSCSGVALLQGVEFALDPNGDLNISDAADVINMSLGSSYGQREDDLSFASANAVRAGVVVVASAGNSADRPYITGSPASTPEVISVAQTQVPSAATIPMVINAPASIAGLYKNTETLDFAPIGAGVTGDVAFVGRGCPAGSVSAGSLEDAYLADPAGKIALIDRGACSVSLKVDRAAKAGAIGVLIGLVAGGDAVSFSHGGGDTFVPSLVIIQSYANTIKANLAAPVNVTISPAAMVPLVGAMVGSSSRGPSFSYHAIKPDIGAPGASMSAEVGTGDGETAFGGTSGAAPMVSGAAALLLDAYPSLRPAEVRARLMNNAYTGILINPSTQPGVLAPITRIGGGEVRVDKAIGAGVAVWEDRTMQGSLSFGYQSLVLPTVLHKRVVVRNYGNTQRVLQVANNFRYANDAASGAVRMIAPHSVRVRANSSTSFSVIMIVDPRRLPTWPFVGYGSDLGTGSLLQAAEFDGYLTFSDGGGAITMPWQILARKAAHVAALPTSSHHGSSRPATLLNLGTAMGDVSSYALVGTSPRLPKNSLPGPGDNFAVVDLRAVGVRYAGVDPDYGDVIEVAINTWGTRAHPAYPAEFDVNLDLDNDGTYDATFYTSELNGFGATGIVVVNFWTGTAGIPLYIADADLNSGNMRMYIPIGAFGVDATSQIGLGVYAFDNYFTGALTDAIEDIVVTPALPKFGPLTDWTVDPGRTMRFNPVRVPGGVAASPSQTGLLLMYRNQAPGFEISTLIVK